MIQVKQLRRAPPNQILLKSTNSRKFNFVIAAIIVLVSIICKTNLVRCDYCRIEHYYEFAVMDKLMLLGGNIKF